MDIANTAYRLTAINGKQVGTLFSTSLEGYKFLHEILSKKQENNLEVAKNHEISIAL